MKCSKCGKEDPKCIDGLCNCCRLKKWRKDNPEKVKAYYEMRKVRDKENNNKMNKLKNFENYKFEKDGNIWYNITDILSEKELLKMTTQTHGKVTK